MSQTLEKYANSGSLQRKDNFEKYRRISLLSVVGELLYRIFLNRFRNNIAEEVFLNFSMVSEMVEDKRYALFCQITSGKTH